MSPTLGETQDGGASKAASIADSATGLASPHTEPSATRRHLPFFYGWVIVAVGFVSLALAYSVWYSFSVFLVALVEDFHWSRGLTSGAFSVFVIAHGLAGTVVGTAVDRFGPRRVMPIGAVILAIGLILSSRINSVWQLYLTYGIICAVGVNAIGWVPNVTVLQRWFSRKLGSALGIASAGVGVGILAVVPFMQYLASNAGWRTAFVALGVMVVVLVIPAVIVFQRSHPRDMGEQVDGAPLEDRTMASSPVSYSSEDDPLVVDADWACRQWTVKSAIRTGRYWLLFAGCVFATFPAQMLLVHQIAYMVDNGRDKMMAASVVGVLGLASVGGKILWGTLSDRIGREAAYSLGMLNVAAGIALLVLMRYVSGVWLIYLYGVVFGVGYAVTAPLVPLIVADLFKGKSFGSIYGSLNIGVGIGSASGALLAGLVFDYTGSYIPAFMLGAVGIIISTTSFWIAAPRKVRRTGKLRVKGVRVS